MFISQEHMRMHSITCSSSLLGKEGYVGTEGRCRPSPQVFFAVVGGIDAVVWKLCRVCASIYRRHTLCTGGLGERPRAMDGVLHGIRLLLLYQNGFHVTLEGRGWSSFLKKKYEK